MQTWEIYMHKTAPSRPTFWKNRQVEANASLLSLHFGSTTYGKGLGCTRAIHHREQEKAAMAPSLALTPERAQQSWRSQVGSAPVWTRLSCVGGERGSTGHDDKQDSPRTAAAVEMASVAAGRPGHLGRPWCGSCGDINCGPCIQYWRPLGVQFTGIVAWLYRHVHVYITISTHIKYIAYIRTDMYAYIYSPPSINVRLWSKKFQTFIVS